MEQIEKAGVSKADELNDIKELLDKFEKLCKKRPILYQHYLIKRNNYSIELLRKIIEKYGYLLHQDETQGK